MDSCSVTVQQGTITHIFCMWTVTAAVVMVVQSQHFYLETGINRTYAWIFGTSCVEWQAAAVQSPTLFTRHSWPVSHPPFLNGIRMIMPSFLLQRKARWVGLAC